MTLLLTTIFVALLIALLVSFYLHQKKLMLRAYLMQEAIHNRDFSFRLSSHGLFFGEKAMQETLNNVGQELRKQIAANEVESWEKLTRVLTHEIMNATTPIASISQAFLCREDIRGTALEDGIRAIHDTSVGLSTFVENYRKLTSLQKPQPENINLLEITEGIKELYPQLTWSLDIDKDTEITTDKTLFRQILINLAKNAKEAEATCIDIRTEKSLTEEPMRTGHSPTPGLSMAISNNGSPIPPELRRDIFTPFFTTKKTGSGIGLSLSRLIMVMQGGELQLADTPISGFHTTFLVCF